jgi:hypothetical protein
MTMHNNVQRESDGDLDFLDIWTFQDQGRLSEAEDFFRRAMQAV